MKKHLQRKCFFYYITFLCLFHKRQRFPKSVRHMARRQMRQINPVEIKVILMELNEALKVRIQELCKERGLTMGGLCNICGITWSTLGNILSGRTKSATVSTIKKICDGLEIDLPEFFDSDLFRHTK